MNKIWILVLFITINLFGVTINYQSGVIGLVDNKIAFGNNYLYLYNGVFDQKAGDIDINSEISFKINELNCTTMIEKVTLGVKIEDLNKTLVLMIDDMNISKNSVKFGNSSKLYAYAKKSSGDTYSISINNNSLSDFVRVSNSYIYFDVNKSIQRLIKDNSIAGNTINALLDNITSYSGNYKLTFIVDENGSSELINYNNYLKTSLNDGFYLNGLPTISQNTLGFEGNVTITKIVKDNNSSINGKFYFDKNQTFNAFKVCAYDNSSDYNCNNYTWAVSDNENNISFSYQFGLLKAGKYYLGFGEDTKKDNVYSYNNIFDEMNISNIFLYNQFYIYNQILKDGNYSFYPSSIYSYDSTKYFDLGYDSNITINTKIGFTPVEINLTVNDSCLRDSNISSSHKSIYIKNENYQDTYIGYLYDSNENINLKLPKEFLSNGFSVHLYINKENGNYTTGYDIGKVYDTNNSIISNLSSTINLNYLYKYDLTIYNMISNGNYNLNFYSGNQITNNYIYSYENNLTKNISFCLTKDINSLIGISLENSDLKKTAYYTPLGWNNNYYFIQPISYNLGIVNFSNIISQEWDRNISLIQTTDNSATLNIQKLLDSNFSQNNGSYYIYVKNLDTNSTSTNYLSKSQGVFYFYGSNTNGYNWLKNSEVNLTNLNSNTNYEVILSYVEVNSYNVNECYDNYYHEINSSLISFKTSFPNNYSSSYSYSSSSSSSYNYIDNITSSITSAISSIYSSAIQSSSSSVKIDTIISSIEGDLQTKIQIENLNGVTISELDNKKIVSTLTELVNGTKVSSNLELSKDGTVTATVTLKNDNIETKQTTLTTEAGVTATILQDGSTKIENISMDTTTGIQTTTDIVLKVDGKSETTVKIKDSTGKMLESVVNTIAGSELTLKQDGSIEQVLSVEKIVTDVKISKNGEIEATLNNEDRIDTKINLPVGSKTEIKENGTITNHITTDKVVTQIEANKKGDSKTVIENIDGIKREITLQEGSQIIATNDGTITATKQEAIQNGTIQNEIIAKSDGEILATIIQSEELVDTKSLRDILYREYNITENVSKKTKLKTINYSLRKDYNSATIEYLSQTEPSNVRNIVKKEPRLKVSYSTRKEYSYNPRDINITETVIDTKTRKMYVKNQQRNIDYNTNITLTPVNDTQFEEVVYLAGYKELKLTNGIVDISSNYEKYGQNREFVIKNAIKFNSTKQQEIQSSKIEEDSSNKYQTEIKLSNNLDLTADILAINKNNNKREKISYSVRKDFDSAKIELIEDLTKSLFDKLDKRLKVTYSTRKSFDFSGDYEFFQEQNSTFNKKESKDVILALILPSDDAKFIERVYFNGIKTIMLIEGSSMITLNEITEQMILNKEYIVPSNKPQTTDDNIKEVKNIQVQFNSGWNQKSSPVDKDITDMFIYGDYDYIYTFSNNNYQKDPEIIKSKQGYWIKSKNMQNINFTGFEYTQNYDLYPRGWSLLGNSENTTIKNIKELNPEIKSVYQYRNNSWNTTDNYILNSGDGYWIYKIDSDINQSIKNGWNLLSIPVDKNTSIEKYSSILVSLYTYRDKNYILNPSIIKPHEGFWLKSTSNATVGFYGNSYNFDVSILKDGWNLVGGKIDSIKSIKEQYSNIEKLYIFEENRYIDDTNIDFIPSGIGYWVYVK